VLWWPAFKIRVFLSPADLTTYGATRGHYSFQGHPKDSDTDSSTDANRIWRRNSEPIVSLWDGSVVMKRGDCPWKVT
jgi:hypothetical protein